MIFAAYDSNDLAKKTQAAGAIDVVLKPVDFARLFALVNRVINPNVRASLPRDQPLNASVILSSSDDW